MKIAGERIEFGKKLLAENEFQIDKRLREASRSSRIGYLLWRELGAQDRPANVPKYMIL